jgi:hypothetical protein
MVSNRAKPVVLVLVLALGAGLLFWILRDGDSIETIQMNGASLPVFDAEQFPDPAFGTKAPIFSSETVDGDYVWVGSGGGPNDPARVILFVSHACGADCDTAVADLVAWDAANDPADGVELMIMSVEEDSGGVNYPPGDWLAELGWTGPTARDDGSGTVFESFGMSATPSWMVLNNLSFVLDRGEGVLDSDGVQRLADIAATFE